MSGLGLYIDLPFCIQRCSFCAFNVRGYRDQEASRYLDALLKEVAQVAKTPSVKAAGPVETIYLGGGTPSRYPIGELSRLIGALRAAFPFSNDPEITLEAHPATLDPDNLLALRALGINRLSLGVQSLQDDDLIAMGRHHTAADVERVFNEARGAGFDDIGIDLIFGLPNQRVSDWENVLTRATSLAPEHFSVYALSVEPGTLWGRQAAEGTLSLPTETEQVAMYRTAQKLLASAGYEQYEISNYSLPGRRCRHNLRYWEGGAYLGLGLSAHSFLSGWRLANTDDLGIYIQSVEGGKSPIVERERLCQGQREREAVLLGLRKLEGVGLTPVHEALLGASLQALVSAGLLVREGERVRLSDRGILLADEVAVGLV